MIKIGNGLPYGNILLVFRASRVGNMKRKNGRSNELSILLVAQSQMHRNNPGSVSTGGQTHSNAFTIREITQ